MTKLGGHRGAQFAAYSLGDVLGIGAHGTTFLARHAATGAQHVIKLLQHAPQDPRVIARLQRTAQLLALAEHPGLVPILGVDQLPDGRPCLIRQHQEGEDLGRRLSRLGALPTAEALRIGTEVGQALQVAHARGVVHQSLKPSDILLCPGGPRLVDFDLARLAAPQERATSRYLLPEHELPDGRSDQFSLGVILGEMLGPAALPGPVWAVLERACAPRKQQRFATMKDFLYALGDALPASLRPAVAPPPAPLRAAAGSDAPRVLIVDDDEDIGHMLRSLLQRNDFGCVTLPDGAEVMERLRRERWDLVILDLAMPGWSGDEICRQIKADPATARIPVVLLSALVLEPAARARLFGLADALLDKPFSNARLLDTVHTLLHARASAA